MTEAVRTVARAIVNESCFVDLLVAAGVARTNASVTALQKRCAVLLEELLDLTLLHALAEDDDRLSEIRRFFLEPQTAYTLNDLAALWRVTLDDAADICHDEIAQWEDSSHSDDQQFRLCWTQAIDTTVRFNLLRPFDVERALGDRFLQAQTVRWRTIPVLIRLPRFVAEAFELDPFVPPRLALAHRIEQTFLEFVGTEILTANATGEVGRK